MDGTAHQVRQFQAVHELKHAIVGGNEVIERKVPIDGMPQCRLADRVRDLCHFADTERQRPVRLDFTGATLGLVVLHPPASRLC
jgi:hypothetical protein